MKQALLIYPHQLFAAELLPKDIDTVFLIEEPLFFGNDTKLPTFFHKQKLVLHRASMRRYIEEVLWPAGLQVEYIQFKDITDSGDIVQKLHGFETMLIFDVVNDELSKRIQTAAVSIPQAPKLIWLDSPNFYLTRAEVTGYFATRKTTEFTEFYKWQRERWNVLIDENYKPTGGKLIYESTSHKRISEDTKIPTFEVYGSNKFVHEAVDYVNKNFPDNPGKLQDFCWPTNHAEAESWLDDFLNNRIQNYDAYSLSFDPQLPWGFHSGISPMLNIGLLNPRRIVDKAIAVYQNDPKTLHNVESFIRGILGFREHNRGVYQTKGIKLRVANPYSNKRLLTSDWYDANTGLEPLDDIIQKLNARGYIHNNERRLIANVMFLAGIVPNDIYRWFYEMTIDSYDWNLVPSVYESNQNTVDESPVSKIEIFGSEYVLTNSHYQKAIWCDQLDGIYWGFVERFIQQLSANPHNKVLIQKYNNLDSDYKRIIGYRANDFLNTKTKSDDSVIDKL